MMQLTDLDRELLDRVADLLPESVFDAHAHVFRRKDLGEPVPGLVTELPESVSANVWKTMMGDMVKPARLEGGLVFPYPTADGDVDRANAFLVDDLAAHPELRGLILVTLRSDPDRVLELLENPAVMGFKPYHVFAATAPTFQAELAAFLPEWIWRLAHQRGLVIMVHLVRDRALADPANADTIVTMCRRYPNARLVLAHAARGFHSRNTADGLSALHGLDNVYFDTSAICQPAALLAILHAFGPRKLLWGSDFPVSHQRGICVSVGDGFAWINPEQPDPAADSPVCRTAAVGVESLLALCDAAETFGLNAEDIEDIFRNNARRLLRLDGEEGTRTASLYAHAKERIPGAVQLLSKRPELQAPGQWPAYFREARGCEIWDLDGRHYYDVSFHGIGAAVLGFRDPDVTRAVTRRINLGSWSTLNPPEEVELADRLCALHPWAEQARFARCGGEIAAVAVRIARATTDRSHVAICGYHGWHDWYLASNLGESDALRGHLLPGLDPLGVPRELRGTAHTFPYNDREALDRIIGDHGPYLAAIIMEPMRYYEPEPGFLEYVRDQAHRAGALLIFDEITIGWRLVYGGSHLRLGVSPDMAIFAKSLGNGHPIAALIGTRAAMEGAHGSFISSSYWTESVGPAAALATLDKMARIDVPAHVDHIGNRVRDAWRRAAAAHNLPVVADDGCACLAHFRFDHELASELRTLYTQYMLPRGFLAGAAIYPTLAHTDEIISAYETAIDEVFSEIAKVLAEDRVQNVLKGAPAHSTFRRLL